MNGTSQRYRIMIRALMAVFLIAGVVGAATAGSAEEQLEQDAYEKIMKMALGSTIESGMGEKIQDNVKELMEIYSKNRDTKVLVSCIYWEGNSVEDLKTLTWWTSYNTFGGRSNLGDLRRRSLNNCKSSAKERRMYCKCQIVDENDKNKLKLPEEWKARVLAFSKLLRDKPDKDICLLLPYGNLDAAKEAVRRELTDKKCKEILE